MVNVIRLCVAAVAVCALAGADGLAQPALGSFQASLEAPPPAATTAGDIGRLRVSFDEALSPGGPEPPDEAARPSLLASARLYSPPDPPASGAASEGGSTKSITWGPLLAQSLGFLIFEHAVRVGFEDGTWRETKEGAFWEDYFNSVKGLGGWDDGDRNTTNFLFHPMKGSTASFMFANNHRASQLTPLGNTGAYWNTKLKQGLFAAAYSAYFELGLVLSETAIGNVGLDPNEQTYLDLVVTPVLGTFFSIGEDLLRVHVVERVNRKNHFWGATLALFLNPTRSMANLVALKTPWGDPEWLVIQREERRRQALRDMVATGGAAR